MPNYNTIKLIVLLAVVGSLFVFSSYRNKHRTVTGIQVDFLGENKLYITETAVSKLLIQNQKAITGLPKDIIDLNSLEQAVNANALIKKAEVFMGINGVVSVVVEQKRPIARVLQNTSYYIDEDGLSMPLSVNYAARVPLVLGAVAKDKLDVVYQFAKAVDNDTFLKTHVVEIHYNSDETLDFKIRKSDILVHLGTVSKLQKKINNFKAFYKKAIKDNILDNYKLVNLKFDKQVICTKV